MPYFDSLVTPLWAELSRLREARRLADRTESPAFSVFRYIAPDEHVLSDLLAHLCDPSEAHAQGDAFLGLFLAAVGIDPSSVQTAGASVRREDLTTHLGVNRFIDFTLDFGTFGVGVENKPWAGDQPAQVPDYVGHLRARYGPGQFCLVYLSGDGSYPTSLSVEDRIRLEQEGCLKTLSYVPDITSWLRGCRGVCRAERVTRFLDDFEAYLREQFGERLMLDNDEMELFTRHATTSAQNLDVALGFVSAFGRIRDTIVLRFLQDLCERVGMMLDRQGPGWRVHCNIDGGPCRDEIEPVVVTRDRWPQGDTGDGPLRVVLTWDDQEPKKPYFQVRREWLSDQIGGPTDCPDADCLAQEVSEVCGRGKRDAQWWPRWYQLPDRYRNWTDVDTLQELYARRGASEYFSRRLVRLATAVDRVVNRGD